MDVGDSTDDSNGEEEEEKKIVSQQSITTNSASQGTKSSVAMITSGTPTMEFLCGYYRCEQEGDTEKGVNYGLSLGAGGNGGGLGMWEIYQIVETPVRQGSLLGTKRVKRSMRGQFGCVCGYCC